MISYRELIKVLRQLNIPRYQPILAHISNSTLKEIKGGSESLLAALLTLVDGLMVPTFTYQSMVIPRTGPMNNALDYIESDTNSAVEVFSMNTPCHPSMGDFAEKVRNCSDALRSSHPLLSFSGIGMDVVLNGQTLSDPWGPIKKLVELEGWVLLAGCDHTRNCILHLAEANAGRKQFIRWALTEEKAVECPQFPGCSKGFNSIHTNVMDIERKIKIGSTIILSYPIQNLVQIAEDRLKKDPLALLCSEPRCEFCEEIRRALI
jgi:aminoglycoside 3-N-acetyltransferase